MNRVRGRGTIGFPSASVIWMLLTASLPGGASPEPVRDFGPAFAMLREFGLPRFAGADYGQFASRSLHLDCRLAMGLQQPLSGNAWRWNDRKTPDRFRVAPLPGGPVIEVDAASAQWKDGNLLKDADALLEFLSGGTASRFEDGSQGSILLFAAALFDLGEKERANRLAATCLASVEDPRGVISGALVELASQRYLALLREHVPKRAWDKLAAELRALCDDFPGIWRAEPLIRELAKSVEDQAKLPEEVRAPGGFELSAEDVDLAKGLRNIQEAGLRSHLEFNPGFYFGWALPPELRPSRENQGDASSVTARIIRKGVSAFPLLLALLEDPHILAVPMTTAPGYGGLSSATMLTTSGLARVAGEDESSGQDDSIRRSFPRPLRVADLAQMLLTTAMPRRSEQSYGDPFSSRGDRGGGLEQLREQALEYYRQNQGGSIQALALRLFRGEYAAGHRPQAMEWLLSHGDEEVRKEVDSRFRQQGDAAEEFELLCRYLQIRGKEGKPVFEAVRERLLKRISIEKGSEKPQMEMRLANLEAIASNKGAAELLSEAMAAEPLKKQALWQSLRLALSKMPPLEAIDLILSQWEKADKQTKGWLSYLFGCVAADKLPPVPELAKRFLPLLDDSDATAALSYLMLSWYEPELLQTYYMFLQQVGSESTIAYFAERARRRFRNEDLGRLPTADSTEPARRAAIREYLLNPGQIQWSSLPIQEQLYAFNLTQEEEGIQNALKISQRKVCVELPDPPPGGSKLPDWEWLREFEGKLLTEEVTGSLVTQARALAAKGQQAKIVLRRSPGPGGFHLQVKEFDAASSGCDLIDHLKEFYGGRPEGQAAAVYVPAIRACWIDPMEGADPDSVEEWTERNGLESTQQQFWSELERHFSPEVALGHPLEFALIISNLKALEATKPTQTSEQQVELMYE